jgi:Family of unknown function (DUF5715)
LSAPLPMCRAVTFAMLLAALSAVSAYGASATTAKYLRKASSGIPAHSRRVLRRSRRLVRRSASATATRSEARRRSPQEVGYEAGLKIRRQLALRNAGRLRRASYAEGSTYHRARALRASLREAAGANPSQASSTGRAEDHVVADSPEQEQAEADGPSAAGRSFDRPSSTTELPSGTHSDRGQPFEDGAETGVIPTTRGIDSGPDRGAEPEGNESRTRDVKTAGEDPLSKGFAAESHGTDEALLDLPRGPMQPLRGSLESLERQNERLEAEGLERIEDEDDLAARIANGLLVPVPASAALIVNPDLPPNHRYCRPWTARFLHDLAASHEAVFHRPLEVSSAVRPVSYQKRLMAVNGNAAPAEGDLVSPHITGATIDISKDGLTREEVNWMRWRLAKIQAEGKIDVEEEFRQRCFHITVYTTYAPQFAPPANNRQPGMIKSDAASETGTQGF